MSFPCLYCDCNTLPELSLESSLMLPSSFTVLQCYRLPGVKYLKIISRKENSCEAETFIRKCSRKTSRRIRKCAQGRKESK